MKIADKQLHGTCIMFNHLSFFKSCKKHLTKLDDDGACPQCGLIDTKDESADFRCSLVIEDGNNDTITEVIIYRRHLKLDIPADGDERI